MKVCILSRNRHCYSTRRLREAATERGHKVKVLNTMKFAISLEKEEPDLFYQRKHLSHYDAVIPRIGASITFYGTAVVRQFQQMGVFCLNSATGISNARDKLRSLQILSRFNIGIPPTEYVSSKKDIAPAIERLGGTPVIIKMLEGTQGIGVLLANTDDVAKAIVETMQSANINVLIQKFVSESRGRDVRAFVVGDRVVASIRRVAKGDEFRSNVHRGGSVEAIELSESYQQTAVRAAQIMGLNVAGVDMLESDEGPQIMEVNSSPGLEGIERATQKDVAGEIIDYTADNVIYPELDIHQRLTVTRKYGVTDLHVGEHSRLAGKAIVDSGLREEDIVVLSLERNGKTISLPKKERTIEVGDTLVCFGNLANMRSLLPPKIMKRRRRKLKKKPESS